MKKILLLPLCLTLGWFPMVPSVNADGHKTLDDRLQADDAIFRQDSDLLKGFSPPQNAGPDALDAIAAKEGVLGCHKWFYPSRKDLWPVSDEFIHVDADTAQTTCQAEFTRLMDLRIYYMTKK